MSDPFADQRLDGKVVVVTGGTQGLGAAIARRAAALGARARRLRARPRARRGRRAPSSDGRCSCPPSSRDAESVLRDHAGRATSASGASTGSSTPPA